MSTEMKVLLFGDQALDIQAFLRAQLNAGRTNPLIRSFFERVGAALRFEVAQLPPSERSNIPDFTTIEELVDRSYSRPSCNVGIESAIFCISQLAHYMEYASNLYGEPVELSKTCIVGLCTGLLAAACVASSPSLPKLIPLGVEVVLIAFRTGLYVGNVAKLLHQPSDGSTSWSINVLGETATAAQAAIDAFHKETVLPISNHAYVSAITDSGVTISGPPSTLAPLFKSPPLFGSRRMETSIHGPYHASHLHQGYDAERILHLSDPRVSELFGQYSRRLPMMSTSTGSWCEKVSTTDLLKTALNQILVEQLQLEGVLNSCAKIAAAQKSSKCQIVPCGSIQAAHNFVDALRSRTKIEIILQDDSSRISPALSSDNEKPRVARKSKLAIVGMAGRFPNSADHEAFWSLLEAGLDVHRKIPKQRFDPEKHYDPTGKKRNTSHTPFGCFIDEPGLFDPRFFNMSPREAKQTDPMHRLGLTTAFEALEMSGYVPNRTPSTRLDRVGTFYGQTSDDWREINAAQDVDTYFITGGVRAFAPGRINYFFKFSGPSFSVDTACSSSMAAIQLACTSLWAGDVDTAVAGGMNVMTNSDIFSGLSRGQFLSKTGNCQTFDNDADGYCRGDGVGTVIIKRLEDAEADNDRILGIILDTATNHSADAISITHPHAKTQEILFKKVLDSAGVDAHDVDYVEMHGTGTQAGDGTEMTSVTNVFAPVSRKGTRKQSLHLGSVKSNIGHGEAVSGVSALIKCLLMLQKSAIPPHCGIKGTINQGFPKDLRERNVHIAFKTTPFVPQNGLPRKIFVNNFSAAGGNTALLIEEGPKSHPSRRDTRSDWVIAVSAKSKSALRANTRRLILYMDNNPDLSIADLSYTTTARRIQHNYRITFSCNNLVKVREILASKLDDTIDPVSNVQPDVAFVFTGQGSHYAALGKQLYETSSLFRSDLNDFNNIACGQGFPTFLPLVTGEVEIASLSPLEVQVGLTCIQMSLTRLWASWGLKPKAVLGHSLGEYAALNAAGVISTAETIYLVGERAKLLQDKCTAGSHAMLAVKASADATEELISGIPGIELACINGPQETVLSGKTGDIDTAAVKLASEGIKCIKLNVPYAFHSSQVDPILADFEKFASSVTFLKPTIPVVSPLLSSVLGPEDIIDASYLSRHARLTVHFIGAISAAQQQGLVNEQTVWIEMGPHPVCSAMVKSSLSQDITAVPSLRKNETAHKTIANSLAALHTAGLSIDWNEYHRDFLDCVQLLDLPAYAFDNQNYWIDYVGNWNLTKGQVGFLTEVPEEVTPPLSTTTVQKIVFEECKDGIASIIIESDVQRPDLFAAIMGHRVNGTPLCPSSIYGDMAFTVGDYLYKVLRPDTQTVHMDVCNMEVFKPLIANAKGGEAQVLRLSATLNLALHKADLVFSSLAGKTLTEHAKCHVKFDDGATWLAEWQRSAFMVLDRIDNLKKAAANGDAHRMRRGMAYKLFTALVDYDPKYRGMEDVILDSPKLEATSNIIFQTTEADGTFFCSPYWIDSVAHLGGFTVNANDAIDSATQVYISHGWEGMRFAEPLSASKTYRSYVRMQESGKQMVAGDVYVFDGDRIIGIVKGMKFQCIPRQLLNTFLPPQGLTPTPRPTVSTAATKAAAPVISAKISKRARSVSKPTFSVVDRVIDIIATEVGISSEELADAIVFADMGVDSLMSLTISGRIREELELHIQSSVFNDHPTVGELKNFFSQFNPPEILDSSYTSDGSITPSLESNAESSDGGSPSTPGTSEDELELGDTASLSMTIRETLATEMGCDIAEMMAVTDLKALGMDSLMSLTILGVLREKTGLSLSSNFLIDNPSIFNIEKALNVGRPEPKPKAKPKTKSKLNLSTTPQLSSISDSLASAKPERSASSVLLQGNPKVAEKTFWLVPDGSGSATSYVFMPEISRKVAVWGLNSPYMKTPEEYTCGVTGMATKFIQEIKRRQPQGPYNIGGWSAGGVISFETVRQLTDAGDVVETLLLIDTPCPLIIEALPQSLHRFFGSIGLLGDGEGAMEKLPAWLLPHFAASVTALSEYTAVKIDPARTPKVFAIWCEDGVCKNPEDIRPDPYPYGHAQWLLENRTDFGPNLWDTYLDTEKITCRQMTGNHFSMMRDPLVNKLVDFLREALL